MPRCPGVVRVPQVNTTLCDGVNEGRGPLTTGQTFDRSGRANTPRRLDPQQSRLLQTSTITVSRLVNHTRYIRSGSSTRLVVIGNAKVRTAGGHPRKHPADRQSQYRFRPTIYPKTGARNAFFPAASVIPSTPIYAATGIWLWFSRPSFCPIARESRGMFGYGRSTGAGD
ncbi:hypothetical protein AlacWU_00183 [Aspergillus niger]|nr:hypothetical protein AlacWU_00183 [Aspergillus niger]